MKKTLEELWEASCRLNRGFKAWFSSDTYPDVKNRAEIYVYHGVGREPPYDTIKSDIKSSPPEVFQWVEDNLGLGE